MTIDHEQDDPMGPLAESFVEGYRRGEKPSIREYALRYPHLADRITRLFPTLVLMEELSPETDEIGIVGQSAQPPQKLGDYEIGDEIGRGGMGVVFRAKQISLNREVALKVLARPLGIRSQDLQRFRLEARAAGQLHHPNIVPVIDVGDEDGMHYYAMQLIQGHGLDLILDELRRQRTLPTLAGQSTDTATNSRQRTTTSGTLETFATAFLSGEFQPVRDAAAFAEPEARTAPTGVSKSVHPSYFRRVAEIGTQLADSLEFAHSAGILHRDVKPSNVLVDHSGHVWVTDFGLAKALENATDLATELTRTGDVVGTIQYMAPERFRGWSDPRSDVYGLGMTLYEMLTFRPAFADNDRLKLMEQVRTRAPAAPRSLNSRIPGDLETIVLKSTEKDPSARYVSAGEMAADLRRYLEGRPILARRSSIRELAWRTCRRNPLVSVLSCLLIGLSVVAWLGLLYSWREAVASDADAREHLAAERRNLNLAVAAVEEFSTKVSSDPRLREHDLRSLRQSLLKTAAKFHETLAELREGSEQGRIDLARSYRGLSKLTAEIESPERALELCRLAITAFDDVLQVAPVDRKIQFELAGTLADAALLLQKQGQSREAEPLLDRGIGILRFLASTDKGGPAIASELAALLDQKAFLLRTRKQYDEAGLITAESLASWDELRSRYPDDSALAMRAARAHFNVGDGHLSRGLKWWREAELELETAWSILKPLINETESSSLDPSFVLALMSRRSDPAKVSGRTDEARTRNQEALRTGRELVLRNPSVLSLQHGMALSLHQMGNLESMSGNNEAAWAAYQEASEIWDRIVRRAPGNVLWEQWLAISLGSAAEIQVQQEDIAAASIKIDRAVDLLEAIHEREPGRRSTEQQLASILSDRARLRIGMKQFELAEPDLARAISLEETMMRENYRINHAWTLVHLGKHREAVAETRAAVAEMSGHVRTQSFGSYTLTGAKTLAVAISQAQTDVFLSPEERDAVVKDYSQATLDLIQKILKSNPNSAAALRDCEEFEPLRSLSEFVALFPQ